MNSNETGAPEREGNFRAKPEREGSVVLDRGVGAGPKTIDDGIQSGTIEGHQLLTAVELAEFLRFTAKSIYQLVHRGKIPYVKVSGALRFNKSDIEAWIEECTFRPGQETKREQKTKGRTKKPQRNKGSKMLTEVERMVEQVRRKYLET
jgi:excisionase family DNA binding protein